MRILGVFALLAATALAEEAAPTVESDAAIQQALLQKLNALADAGKTKTAPELVATRPDEKPTVVLEKPAGETLDGEALCRRLREGTVIVGSRYKCKKCTHWHLNAASGFLISADGVVVTNRHVIASPDHEAMAVMDGRGEVYGVVALLGQDEAHDVALLRIAGEGFRPLALAEGEPAAGAEVAVLSHPAGRYWTYTTGVVSRVAEWWDAKTPAVKFPVITITAAFAPGSSGGPVADRRGNVIGIATRIQPLTQAKSEEGKAEGNAGEYTAMVLPMAVPVRWVRQMIRAGTKGGD